MSGCSRGRKSSRAKSRGKGRAKGRVRGVADDAPRDPDPPRCPGPGEEAQAAQVQAGAGRGGLETAAPADPRPRAEEATCRLPLDCGLAMRARAAGGRGRGKPTALSWGHAGFVGTVDRQRNGPRVGDRCCPLGKKFPETCSAAGRAPQAAAGGGGGEAEKAGPGEGGPAAAPVAVAEEEQAEKDAGAGPPATEGSMDTLETVQSKLETMNAQADRAYLRLSRKFGQLRLHHLERRNLLIQNIPGFWGQAFQNHPQLAGFLNPQDKDVLAFLNSLEVEELGLARLGYKIKFYFGRNPYFQNKVLIKEYGCGPSGQVVSRSTPIQWLPGHDLQTLSQGDAENSRSFFGWFQNHSSIESDKIVEIINEELWPNPLQYYLMSEGARAEKGKEDKQDAGKQPGETPGPAGNQPK
ncbi:testis-specific Y-encoded-like protein 5 [Erinaceus europaeus]|uniref:Testis-specific Y-encoded-like protein 5 n=1 Tax=Erinaceus europaeus TaxID=9365 RepID=A0ABM3XT29_ERIEU|nr:testis-specific Y-encoded-like protein 5 [Erinaceus europaeus]XP_060051974.1 testis-specific Y-encoded-like protein 5 [Erinaceus europaeus]XP_060051975.1 testis-specific Y-encoded-like protein 5 [Erinaceus europaeus]XP_060051976.1 testis-specific Y-encoded-like protein 5 [Erinaceus europaeus]